jgi:hypothetical protein
MKTEILVEVRGVERGVVGSETSAVVRSGLRAAYVLSGAIAGLMVAASGLGVFVHDLYRDDAWGREALRGGDLVTFVVVVPVLIVTLITAIRGSMLAQPVLVGTLAYSVYNYAFYTFGAQFNDVFLLHIALMSLSIFALACAVPAMDRSAIRDRLRADRAARWIGAFLIVVGAAQGALWAFLILRFAVNGHLLHDIPVAGQHLVFALDLGISMPSVVFAGILLYRRTAMGYLLGTAMVVMGAAYQLNLMVAGVFQARADVSGVKAFPPESLVLTAAFLVSGAVLLGARTISSTRLPEIRGSTGP